MRIGNNIGERESVLPWYNLFAQVDLFSFGAD